MRGGLEVGEGDGCVLEDCAGPCFAKLGGYFDLQAAELGEDVVVVCVLVAGFDPDLLACAEGVVACVSLLDGLLEEGGGVCADDYCGPCFEVVDGLTDFRWVVVEGCGIHRYKAQVIPRLPDIISCVAWVIMGLTNGVTPVYGAWVPSKSTTKISREERFCSTLNKTAQYILRTISMNVHKIRAAKWLTTDEACMSCNASD